MAKTRVAVIDDWQNAARDLIDWSPLEKRAEIVFFQRHFGPREEYNAPTLLPGSEMALEEDDLRTLLQGRPIDQIARGILPIVDHCDAGFGHESAPAFAVPTRMLELMPAAARLSQQSAKGRY